jgi:tRNA-splicing ligase RtcB (3'-phosphate/5'-hydroxy nucleic acid ligase)
MPDVHWGYGFPIGGVAATGIDADGVISPGGVGFDISCGVRLPVSRELDRNRLQPRIRAVMDRLDVAIPRGVGTKGAWRVPDRGVLEQAGLARKVAHLIPLGVVRG